MTNYLRATDRTSFEDALRTAGLMATNEDGTDHPVTSSHNHALVIMGVVTVITAPAEYDADGNEISPAQTKTLDGYHANWKSRDGGIPEALQPFVLEPQPATPLQVFQGESE